MIRAPYSPVSTATGASRRASSATGVPPAPDASPDSQAWSPVSPAGFRGAR